MAIYHLNAKTLGRSQGRSATGAAAYRAAVRIEDARTGIVFDFRRKRGVDGSEILAPDGSAPDRAALWNAVEQTEKRTDAQVAREIEVALPRELTAEQMRATVRGFVREQFVALGMVADVAFHHLTGSNPHAHILLTMREWRDGSFGLKRRDWNDRALCQQWRERWADHANAALSQAGQAARIDHRTLIEQAAAALPRIGTTTRSRWIGCRPSTSAAAPRRPRITRQCGRPMPNVAQHGTPSSKPLTMPAA